MPQPKVFPFRRVSVDHMMRGVSRIWWQLERNFREPGPYVFQLQSGKTGLRDAADWKNVGAPVTNAYVAYDPSWDDAGYDLLTHYRVTLTTPTSLYVSQAASCFGELTERDWLLSREIVRREKLRHRFVSTPGYLIKPMRFGTPCPRCRDEMTQELLDSNCPVCNGTGFEVGYHPPLEMQCWDLSPQTIAEDIDIQVKGTTRVDPYVTARVIGFPALNYADVWVNGASDERWQIKQIKVAAAIRNVPLVYEVQMGLLPFTSTIYAIEVGGEPADRPGPVLPIEGCGSVVIDHNFGGADNLIYTDLTGDAVVGAKIYVFKKVVADSSYPALPNRNLAVAGTETTANGRWTTSIRLDPGDYVLLFEKPGEYGPDTKTITVTASGTGTICEWYPELALGEGEDIPDENEEADILATEDTEDEPNTEDDGNVITTDSEDKLCRPANQPPPPEIPDDFWNI